MFVQQSAVGEKRSTLHVIACFGGFCQRGSESDDKRLRSQTHVIHLSVVDAAVIDGLLYVTWQLRQHLRSVWLRHGRLERVWRENAFKPRHPLLEKRRVLGLVVPVQHLRLERDSDLRAVLATYALCRTIQKQTVHIMILRALPGRITVLLSNARAIFSVVRSSGVGPNKAALNVCPPYSLRPSVHKSLPDLNRNLVCSRGRWVLYDDMRPIQPDPRSRSRSQTSDSYGNGRFQILSSPPVCSARNQKTIGELWHSKTISKFCPESG